MKLLLLKLLLHLANKYLSWDDNLAELYIRTQYIPVKTVQEAIRSQAFEQAVFKMSYLEWQKHFFNSGVDRMSSSLNREQRMIDFYKHVKEYHNDQTKTSPTTTPIESDKTD